MGTERAAAGTEQRGHRSGDSTGRSPRKVLVLAYRFPPQGGGGVQRTLKFVKYLPGQNWLPIVQTVKNPYWPFQDETLLAEIPPFVKVHGTRTFEFERLGRDLLGEGISVSTIGLGLGYNEDLMLQLARASDGNHAFATGATDLIQIFNREFDDALGSCAQTVSIDVELRPGVRAVRAVSRDGVLLLAADHVLDETLIRQIRDYAAAEGMHQYCLPVRTERRNP